MTAEPLRLAPTPFFELSLDCHYAPTGKALKRLHRLPPPLHGKEVAEISLGWNEAGIILQASIASPFDRSSYPNFEKSDALLLFIDTRHHKQAGSIHSFCHHFFFLPKPVDGVQAGEYTRFRSEEARELCDANQLLLKVDRTHSSVEMQVQIPATCLHGFDPEEQPRMGFSYVLQRGWRSPQSLNGPPRQLALANHPTLWATCNLIP